MDHSKSTDEIRIVIVVYHILIKGFIEYDQIELNS